MQVALDPFAFLFEHVVDMSGQVSQLRARLAQLFGLPLALGDVGHQASPENAVVTFVTRRGPQVNPFEILP